MCAGTAGLGDMPEVYGYSVPEERALATIRRILRGPLNFLDTSAGYGGGESERRIGTVIGESRGLPAGFVLATKIDPDPRTGRFDGDAAARSVEGSLRRLGLDRLQLVHLHDPERITFREGMGRAGPVEALVRLQSQGVIGHLGVAGGHIGLMRLYAATGAFQVVLTHNRSTLVDRSAETLLQDATRAGLGVLNAAVFGGGILAAGPERRTRYAYREAGPTLRDAIRRMQTVCREAGIPLPAAALQYSLRDPRVVSTLVGVSRPERVDAIVELAAVRIPQPVWQRLEALLPDVGGWLG